MGDLGRGTLTRIKNHYPDIHNPLIDLLYKKEKLESKDSEFLFSVALILIKEYENKPDKNFYLDFAYQIIAKTSFKIDDYHALYDFTVNYGYYPISRKITELKLIEDISINRIFSEISMDDFVDQQEKMLTYEQKNMFDAVLKDGSIESSFLAPTSYGKSEIIFDHIEKNNKNVIGIIVPTKALIDQVYKEAKKKITDRRIIIHDQSYIINDEKILAVVTQERALRLLEEGLIFDQLYIDEAHEILDFDYGKKQSNRSLLLARMIKIAKIKNTSCGVLYLSPVLNESKKLKLKEGSEIPEHKISNDLKILDVKFLGHVAKQSERALYQYDRYLGEFIYIRQDIGNFEYIKQNSKKKNLHFLYRPIFIERYAKQLFDELPDEILVPDGIKELISELKKLVHEDFLLAEYLKKGIIYIHAKLPQNIKNYLLYFVKNSEYIKHFVANNVVLAGMNLPIDNLFYVSGNANLRDLYNLIGRVNRLNEIFSSNENNLKKILIPVHFLEIDEYPQKRSGKLEKKIEKLREKFNDEVKNPLLQNSKIEDKNQKTANDIVESENKIIEQYERPEFKQKLTLAGAQQILNYTDKGLSELEKRMKEINSDEIDILDLVKKIFFDGFSEGVDFVPEYNAKRLSKSATIDYYKMFINNLQTLRLNERIDSTVAYWKRRQKVDDKIFVGSSFGEVTFDSENYSNSRNKVYVLLSDHIDDQKYLINLAVVKLQIDEEYLGHEINLLINTLLKFELITQEQFDDFYYGTNDENELKILQLGLSRQIFNQLKNDKLIQNIIFDKFGNAKADGDLKKYIQTQTGIVKFELEQFFM